MAVASHTKRQVLWSVLAYGVPALATLVITPRVVAGLGADRYGLLLLAMTTIGALALVDLGISAASVRELSVSRADPDCQRTRVVFSTTVALYAVVALLAGAAVLAGVPWLVDFVFAIGPHLREDASVAMHWAAAGLALNLLLAPWNAYLRAAEYNDAAARIGILAALVGYAGALWRGVLGDLSGALGWQVAASMLSLALSVWTVRVREPERVAWICPRWHVLRAMGRFALWQFASIASAAVGQHLARLVIARQLGPADLAWFAVPFSLAQRIQKVVESAARALFPRLARLAVDHADELAAVTYRQAQKTILAAGMAAAVPLAMGAQPLLTAWLGQEFAAHGSVPLAVVSLGYAMGCLGIGYVAALLAHGDSRSVFAAETANTLVNVVSLWPLMHWFGLDGVALSFLLGWLSLIVPHRAVARRLGPKAHAGLLRVAAGGLAIAAVGGLCGRLLANWLQAVGVIGPLAAIGLACALSMVAMLWTPGLFGCDADLQLALRAALLGRILRSSRAASP
ncbi:MAG: oligosaccharide flippase family protein [Deltaproteobacteria bacterium]|nr:oligosaccharide flippase family protein [Deltaproteobacteria bacterium]